MNDIWTMDFMSDWLFDGRPFRILTVVDCHTRESLSTASRTNFRAYQVVEELDRIVRLRGKPKSLRVDNGPEFAGRMLDQWAYLNGVTLDFSRPGKPTDNAFIEAFNSRLRQECLNASWFLSMADARTPDRRLEDRLQSKSAAYEPRWLDAGSVRCPTSTSPNNRMKPGPKMGEIHRIDGL